MFTCIMKIYFIFICNLKFFSIIYIVIIYCYSIDIFYCNIISKKIIAPQKR